MEAWLTLQTKDKPNGNSSNQKQESLMEELATITNVLYIINTFINIKVYDHFIMDEKWTKNGSSKQCKSY